MRFEHFWDFFLSFGALGRKRPLSQPNFVITSSRESHIVVTDRIVQAQQLVEPFLDIVLVHVLKRGVNVEVLLSMYRQTA